MTYVLYNTLDGLVRGFCNEDEAPVMDGCETFQLPEQVIQWPAGDPEHAKLYFLEGELVWQDSRTLTEIKAAKNQQINAARLKANRSSFMFDSKEIACDELSRSDIDAVNGVVSLLGIVPITEWKAVDNTYVQIPDKPTWVQFYLAMVQQGQQNFAKAQALKAQLASAETVEQVNSIQWTPNN